MNRTGTAKLPLHGGHAPRWLFQRMVKLSGAITESIVYEYGQNEFLRRLSDPHWFQAFSCVLGFDWHSSGTTTTTCGALKTYIKPEEHGIMVAGGKGHAARKTLDEIKKNGDLFSLSSKKIDELTHNSRISAKIDNSCIQDGYNLYHHSFFFTKNGKWAVVQQGLNSEEKYARRYHWLSEALDNPLKEPHQGIACDQHHEKTLNMTAQESEESQKISVDLICDNPDHLKSYFKSKDSAQTLLTDYFHELNISDSQGNYLDYYNLRNENLKLEMPRHHPVLDMDLNPREFQVLKNAWEIQPQDYEELISLKGIGPKKIRALALISDLVYGAAPSWTDPVKYSFTHGGKDGYPYPVNREVYDNSIQSLKDALHEAKLDNKDKYHAIKRLEKLVHS
ncbi:MAG: DUF763 domain-containing protein [Methanobacteriaceae archaeon]|nr:DUF763 domain-containing protein [Methanobacteriaceae archaeon]